jgi:hypothetical protein
MNGVELMARGDVLAVADQRGHPCSARVIQSDLFAEPGLLTIGRVSCTHEDVPLLRPPLTAGYDRARASRRL